MPIDPRIALGVQTPEPINPLALYSQVQQVRNQQQRGQINQQEIAANTVAAATAKKAQEAHDREQAKSLEEEAAYHDAAAQATDPDDLLKRLRPTLRAKTYLELEKGVNTARKERLAGDADALKISEAKNSHLAALTGQAAALTDEEYAAKWPEIAAAAKAIDPTLEIPAQPIDRRSLALLRSKFLTHEQLDKEAQRTISEKNANTSAGQLQLEQDKFNLQKPGLTPNADGLTPQQVEQAKSPLEREYTYAKANGFTGTLEQYQNVDANRKRQNINVNANNNALDRESKRFATPYEKILTESGSQLEKINEAREMVNGSAEAQALGLPKVLTALVSGAGSGVRITQAELNSIGSARGVKGNVEGWLRSISGEGKLTKEQQAQLTQVLDDVGERVRAKRAVANEALDKINGSGTRDEMVKHEANYRRLLDDTTQSKPNAGAPKTADEYLKGIQK